MPGELWARSLFDGLRNIDLNDYAVGVTVSSRALPYRGAGTSSIAYPFLTSVADSTLTKDAFVIRNGAFGLRRVTESGLELGLLGHVETLGYGTDPDSDLERLDPPAWTAEIGPTIGWRRGAIQPDLALRKGVFGGHSGWVGELSLSFPRPLDRGFLVPYLSLVHQDDQYVSHYYGVRPRSGPATLPPFDADDALNYRVGLRAGYRLSDAWILTGSLSVDWLDAVIGDSPAVDQDRVGAVSLGVAYNRSIFRKKNPDALSLGPPRRVRLSAIAVDARVDSDLDVRGAGSLDLEDRLALPEEATLYRTDLTVHVAPRHRIEIGYAALARSGQLALAQPLEIGDVRFESGESISGRFRTELPRVAYGYSLLRDEQKELGVLLGVQWPRLEATVGAASGSALRSDKASSPFFSFGAFGEVAMRGRFSARARVEIAGLDFDRYEGVLVDGQLGAVWEPAQHLGVTLGYALHHVSLDGLHPGFTGTASQRFHGPFLGVSLAL